MTESTHTELHAGGLRLAVVTSRWHPDITGAMRDAATATFEQAGGAPADLLHVDAPGAWELGVLCAGCLERDDIDGVLAIGCVITGETTHDKWINHGLSSALASLAVMHAKPVALGVLTCPTKAHAQARSGGAKGNKGEEAMSALIESCATLQALHHGADA